MKFAYTRNMISADFLTSDYRISCRIAVPAGGLNSLLMDPLNSYLELEDAYISRINRPGEIVGSYTQCAFRKENINFVISQEVRRSVPRATGFLSPRQSSVEVFLTVPSFEIKGTVRYEGVMSPVHLLTRECFELYLQHMKQPGIIAAHIGNPFIDLEPLLDKLAQKFQMRAVKVFHRGDGHLKRDSIWVLISRDDTFVVRMLEKSNASTLRANKDLDIWTDQFSNIFSLLN